jgi:hypothetical protein
MPGDPTCYPPHRGHQDSPPPGHRRLLPPVGARHRWSLRGRVRVPPEICSWRHRGTFILECAVTNNFLKPCTGPLRALPWTRSTEACNLRCTHEPARAAETPSLHSALCSSYFASNRGANGGGPEVESLDDLDAVDSTAGPQA